MPFTNASSKKPQRASIKPNQEDGIELAPEDIEIADGAGPINPIFGHQAASEHIPAPVYGQRWQTDEQKGEALATRAEPSLAQL